MEKFLSWPRIRLVQRISMVLTLCCFAYVIFFLLSKDPENHILQDSNIFPISQSNINTIAPSVDLKPYDVTGQAQTRDIFSLNLMDATGNVENTPKGQLPNHLKIVGIILAHPSQIIIEDTFANKTYFIDEEHPSAGIKIVSVTNDQMTVNYQDQDIVVPITKNS